MFELNFIIIINIILLTIWLEYSIINGPVVYTIYSHQSMCIIYFCRCFWYWSTFNIRYFSGRFTHFDKHTNIFTFTPVRLLGMFFNLWVPASFCLDMLPLPVSLWYHNCTFQNPWTVPLRSGAPFPCSPAQHPMTLLHPWFEANIKCTEKGLAAAERRCQHDYSAPFLYKAVPKPTWSECQQDSLLIKCFGVFKWGAGKFANWMYLSILT